MVEIKKRSGIIELFDREKIMRSIKKASIDACYPKDQISILADVTTDDAISASIKEMGEKEGEIDTDIIRKNVLHNLDSFEPSVSKSWRKFDTKYKFEL